MEIAQSNQSLAVQLTWHLVLLGDLRPQFIDLGLQRGLLAVQLWYGQHFPCEQDYLRHFQHTWLQQ